MCVHTCLRVFGEGGRRVGGRLREFVQLALTSPFWAKSAALENIHGLFRTLIVHREFEMSCQMSFEALVGWPG